MPSPEETEKGWSPYLQKSSRESRKSLAVTGMVWWTVPSCRANWAAGPDSSARPW